MTREVELKLELEPSFAEALKRHDLLAGTPRKKIDQLSTYFDTPDGAVRGAGFSLRVREAKGKFVQTIKHSEGPAAGLFDRPEWEMQIGSGDLDLEAAAGTPLGAILSKKVRKKLQPLIQVEVQRSVWDVSHDGSAIELILDEGKVTGGNASEAIAEVELELKEGEAASLIALAREIGRAVPFRLGVLTKAERGYRLADGSAGKVRKAEPIELRTDMKAADGFAIIFYACLRHFRLNEDLIVRRRDPGALHQSRVAMRRLRSAFSLFRTVIADEEYQRLREEVRWFTNQLGDARNLDVMLKRFPANEAEDRMRLRQILEERRELAYDGVLDALGSQRLRMLMIDLVGWVETGVWRVENPPAQRPLTEFARTQLDKRWRKVKKGGAALGSLEPEPRHQLRIEVKKLRYAVEFLASLISGEERLRRQKTFVGALEEMQERLGELNDAETAQHLLGDLFSETEDPASLNQAREQLASPQSEQAQLVAAQEGHSRLLEAGPYWR
jgi:inorganic triphosphatase YgiF